MLSKTLGLSQEACHKLRPVWAREKDLDSENKTKGGKGL